MKYFRIVAYNLSETTECTWKWKVKPLDRFDRNVEIDNKADAYATYGIKFTGPNAQDYHNSITVLYD